MTSTARDGIAEPDHRGTSGDILIHEETRRQVVRSPARRVLILLDRFPPQSAFELILSPAIIDEIRETLADPKVQRYVRAVLDAPIWFETIVLLSHAVAGEYEVDGMSLNPDDDKYVRKETAYWRVMLVV